jgi:acyl-CoA reductase-like NAD-dependent aldehyde dehydrogenase
VPREPLGVVALITPWNFPFTLPIRKVAAALTTGNAALLKPAPNAVLTALAIAIVLTEAGLPPGVLNVVPGNVSEFGDALLSDPLLAGVSFTGSYATASVIHKSLAVELPLQAELGGKNALVIWKDADLSTAVPLIWASSFRNNGQICTSAGRLLVHTDIADELLDRLRAEIDRQPTGEDIGKRGVLSSVAAYASIGSTIDRNSDATSEVLAPGWPAARMGPTILVRPADGELVHEEIFGPVLTFETVSSVAEAIASANRTAYGLTAGIVTNDLAVEKALWQGAAAGTVKVNAPLTGTPFHVPMQGFQRSGAGNGEGGTVSVEFFTRKKSGYISRT